MACGYARHLISDEADAPGGELVTQVLYPALSDAALSLSLARLGPSLF
jgi:hypothetical protein